MPKKNPPRRARLLCILCGLVAFLSIRPAESQQTQPTTSDLEKVYRPKSQIFSIKSEILGGEFRITNVIPLHGDFSQYQKIEITNLKSLVGNDIQEKTLADYDEKVFKEFQTLEKIKVVAKIPDYHPPAANQDPQTDPADPPDEDSLDGPMLTYEDLQKFDHIRALKEAGLPVPGEPQRTLAIVAEVLDYEKGNHVLQYLPFNIGSSIITIRFRYYDEQTGEEMGRQIITGEVSSDTYAGFLGMHSALKGVVEGFADQVTRRVLESER